MGGKHSAVANEDRPDSSSSNGRRRSMLWSTTKPREHNNLIVKILMPLYFSEEPLRTQDVLLGI